MKRVHTGKLAAKEEVRRDDLCSNELLSLPHVFCNGYLAASVRGRGVWGIRTSAAQDPINNLPYRQCDCPCTLYVTLAIEKEKKGIYKKK